MLKSQIPPNLEETRRLLTQAHTHAVLVAISAQGALRKGPNRKMPLPEHSGHIPEFGEGPKLFRRNTFSPNEGQGAS